MTPYTILDFGEAAPRSGSKWFEPGRGYTARSLNLFKENGGFWIGNPILSLDRVDRSVPSFFKLVLTP